MESGSFGLDDAIEEIANSMYQSLPSRKDGWLPAIECIRYMIANKGYKSARVARFCLERMVIDGELERIKVRSKVFYRKKR